jgi:outer membrane protein assembly factor BamA
MVRISLPRWLLATVAAVPLVGLLSAPASAQSSARNREDRPEVRSLVLDGVKSVDGDLLRESIETTASSCRGLLFQPFCVVSHSARWWQLEYLDHVELRRDVLRIKVFYWRRGYREASVDTTVQRTGDDAVRVTFRITEGPPTIVSAMRVERPESLITRRRMRRIRLLRAGQPLDLLKLDSTVIRLRDEMWNRGYGDAALDTSIVVDTTTRRAAVTITIDPKWKTYVGAIVVQGNDEVTTRTIRSSLSFGEGDPYERSAVALSQRRLYESNLFRRAAIIVPPQRDSVKRIDITVAEAPHHVVRTSAGFNTVDFLQVDGRFTRYNFFGGARRLDIQAAIGNLLAPQLNGKGIFYDVVQGVDGADQDPFLKPTWQASADFNQPWFLSHRNSIGASVFGHRRSAPGVYIDNGFGASGSATREVALRTPVSLNYRFELAEVEAGDVYFCVSFGVCDPATIDALQGQQRLSPILLTATADHSDNPFAPMRGYVASLDLEHASAFTLSDFRYNRVFASATYYHPLGGERRVVAINGRVGWVNPLASTGVAVGAGDAIDAESIVHPRKRFYAGGARSVRGLGENQLGPRVLTVAPAQLSFCSADGTSLPTSAELAACDLSSAAAQDNLRDRDFTPRPLGGNTLLQGSVEYRFPLVDKLSGAVFVDGAFVGTGTLNQVAKGAGALTPGLGIRYRSPVGAIRVDIGLNPTPGESLPVITQVDENGERHIVQVGSKWHYDPTASKGGFTGLLNRFTLHLSIGEAY